MISEIKSANVRIANVQSYADVKAIEHFVKETLTYDPEIRAFLSNSETSRLIVIKPNWVQEAHEYNSHLWEPVITHPNLIVAVVKVIANLMGGTGTICICDAPHAYASFDAILKRGNLSQRLQELRVKWPALKLRVLDLRREVTIRREEVVVARRANKNDPFGYVKVDLKEDSFFYGYKGEGRYYGADYDSRVVNEHHHGNRQEYLIAGTPMACDLFINLPKLKTHKKTGITCCLKNLVGINGDKNWLPHHTEGCPTSGGDEFPKQSVTSSIEAIIKRLGLKIALRVPWVGTWVYRKMRNTGKCMLGDSAKVIRNGNWSGNDTCWRMCLDLNRALLYGNMDGTWREATQAKRYLAIVDGIVGGEGNGPLCPDPVQSNVLVAGTNPAEIDAVVAKLMGVDPKEHPIVMNAFETHRWPIANRKMDEVVVSDSETGHLIALSELTPVTPGGFKPHFGWEGHLQRAGG